MNVALSDRRAPDADVLLLNPDARVSRDQIGALRVALHAAPDLASVGPVQTDDSGRAARVEWPFPTPANAWLEAIGLGRLQRARFVIGSVLLLRAEALAQVGGFDERFFLYAEETDWAYRASLGWRHAAVPGAQAVHAGRRQAPTAGGATPTSTPRRSGTCASTSVPAAGRRSGCELGRSDGAGDRCSPARAGRPPAGGDLPARTGQVESRSCETRRDRAADADRQTAHRADRPLHRRGQRRGRGRVQPASASSSRWGARSSRSPTPRRTGHAATVAAASVPACVRPPQWCGSPPSEPPRAALPRRAPRRRVDLPQQRDDRRHLRQPRRPPRCDARTRQRSLADGPQSDQHLHLRTRPIRYRSSIHRAVVALSASRQTPCAEYGRVRSRDRDHPQRRRSGRFRPRRPPSAREAARASTSTTTTASSLRRPRVRPQGPRIRDRSAGARTDRAPARRRRLTAIDAPAQAARVGVEDRVCSSARGPTCRCSSPRPTSSCSPSAYEANALVSSKRSGRPPGDCDAPWGSRRSSSSTARTASSSTGRRRDRRPIEQLAAETSPHGCARSRERPGALLAWNG